MKIWILLLMLAFAENSSLDNSLSRRVVKREFNVQNAEKTTFVQNIFFNTVGKVMPQGWLLNAVINLFKSAQSKPSIIDQIREEVQKGVMKGITNFYNDFLYTEVTSCQVFGCNHLVTCLFTLLERRQRRPALDLLGIVEDTGGS